MNALSQNLNTSTSTLIGDNKEWLQTEALFWAHAADIGERLKDAGAKFESVNLERATAFAAGKPLYHDGSVDAAKKWLRQMGLTHEGTITNQASEIRGFADDVIKAANIDYTATLALVQTLDKVTQRDGLNPFKSIARLHTRIKEAAKNKLPIPAFATAEDMIAVLAAKVDPAKVEAEAKAKAAAEAAAAAAKEEAARVAAMSAEEKAALAAAELAAKTEERRVETRKSFATLAGQLLNIDTTLDPKVAKQIAAVIKALGFTIQAASLPVAK